MKATGEWRMKNKGTRDCWSIFFLTLCTCVYNLFVYITIKNIIHAHNFKNTVKHSVCQFSYISKIPLCYQTVSVYMLSCFSCVWLFATLWTVACRLLCPWDSPGKNTGVGCHALLQGSSRTSNQTCISWIAGRFFIHWATWEALSNYWWIIKVFH